MRSGRLTRRGWVVLATAGLGLAGLALPTASSGLARHIQARPVAPPPAPDPAAAAAMRRRAELERAEAAIRWRRSRSLGSPTHGRLVAGVQLPAEGVHFVTWDPATKREPSPGWRRNGSDRLVRLLLRVAAAYAAAHPDAPRLVVGDLSRPHGGDFGRRYGGGGHASHQNGLDVDVYYPRRDGREAAPASVAQIDLALAQDLLDRFVRARARFVFVGAHTGLRGPPKVVGPWPEHDNHMHVRIWP